MHKPGLKYVEYHKNFVAIPNKYILQSLHQFLQDFNTNTNHTYQVLNLLNGNLQKFYVIVFLSDHPICCFYSNSFRTMSHRWGAIKNDIFLMLNIIFLKKRQVYSFYYSKLLYKLGENSEKIS